MRNSKFGMRSAECGVSIPHSACRVPHARSAFTLLEVLLAIAIAVLVMALVGTALFMQLRTIEETHHDIGQAQLARALTRHIGDDLRNVIKYDPSLASLPPLEVNLASLASSAAGVAGTTSGGTSGAAPGSGAPGTSGTGSQGSGGSAPGGSSFGGSSSPGSGSTPSGSPSSGSPSSGSTSSGATSSSSMSSSSTSTDPSSGTEPAPVFDKNTVPGLRGENGLYGPMLSFEVSLLPRRDQLLMADQSGVPSGDVRTVSYYVDPEAGLMRSESSRASWQGALTQGGDTDTMLRDGSKVLAPEVVGVEFEYYDGELWSDIWPPAEPQDDASAALLPKAVHIVLYFRPRDSAGQIFSTLDLGNLARHEMFVPLPTAELPSEIPSMSGSSSSGSSNSNSSSSSSSSPNSGSSSTSSSSGSSGGTGSGSSGTGGGR